MSRVKRAPSVLLFVILRMRRIGVRPPALRMELLIVPYIMCENSEGFCDIKTAHWKGQGYF